MDDNLRGQRTKKCDIIGCQEMGRILATLGGIEISYCAKHRKKYGERIIDAMINSLFNYKLTNFLTSVKKEIFFNKECLCKDCGIKLSSYIIEKTTELENILDFAEENEITDSRNVDNIDSIELEKKENISK